MWLWRQFPESSLPVSTEFLDVNPFSWKAGPSQCRLVLLGVLNAFPWDNSLSHFPFHSLYSSAVEFLFDSFLCFLACLLSPFSRVWLFVTPGTVAHPAPLSMGFSRQGYWSGLPRPSNGFYLCVRFCVLFVCCFHDFIDFSFCVSLQLPKLSQDNYFELFIGQISWQIDGETAETVIDFIFGAPKSLQMATAVMKLKDAYSLEGKLWPT